MELSKLSSKSLLSALRGAIRPEKQIERPRGEDGALPSLNFGRAKVVYGRIVSISKQNSDACTKYGHISASMGFGHAS